MAVNNRNSISIWRPRKVTDTEYDAMTDKVIIVIERLRWLPTDKNAHKTNRRIPQGKAKLIFNNIQPVETKNRRFYWDILRNPKITRGKILVKG